MANFPWKKGNRGKGNPLPPNPTSNTRTVTTPNKPRRLPPDNELSYGGALAKEYWKRGVKKF